ncbi:hypothetical protein [Herbaspirillum robiniae]|uniref:DUF1488 domain-containing protein n=1 Tax=Herbaspirillum robiniae TaxID=2014887 RepID=A0ABX2LWI5_9BURK|nr:hypothetical protein [Herbaspirillum robiniae]NUU02837.1 hypothetical protein [Herbaspirillum robiniae]
MHTSRIKFFKGFQIEVTVTSFGVHFYSFTNIRRLTKISAAGGEPIFSEWVDQRARSCAMAFQNAFERAHTEIEKHEMHG